MAIYVYKQIACMYGKVRRFHWDRKSNTIKCVEAIVWIRRLLLYKKRKIAKFQIMKHLVQLCFCSDFDDFLFAQRHLVVSLRIAWEVNGCDFHQVQAKGLACTGAEGPEARRAGSGDENSCLLWLVAASARSGKSVELEPSCESPHGNKSFLTSPLTHHTAAQNQACVSALLLCVNVHICAGSSSVCECRCVSAAGSVFYSTPWNNSPLLRMGCFMLSLNKDSVQTIAYCISLSISTPYCLFPSVLGL